MIHTHEGVLFMIHVCVCQVKVTEARHAVTEVTRHHTERLLSMNSLLNQKKEMEDKLNTRQSKMVLYVSKSVVFHHL